MAKAQQRWPSGSESSSSFSSSDPRPGMMTSNSNRMSSRKSTTRRGPSRRVLGLGLGLGLTATVLMVGGAAASSPMGTEEARMYDRNLQHFSPEGRLYQVQYAERAAQRGSPVLALSNGKDALALCCERRRVSRLEDFAALEKLGEVQPPPSSLPGAGGSSRYCAYLGFAGLAADGRRLLDRTRLFAENYRLRHGEDPGVRELALSIADTQHRNTFVRAHRPYGVACVLAGFDGADSSSTATTTIPSSNGGSTQPSPSSSLLLRPRIFVTGPSGAVQEHRAVCVGENREAITTRMEAHWKEVRGMTARQMARFGARLLMDARGASGGAGARGGEEENEGEGPGFEVEVLVLQRRKAGAAGGAAVRVRRVLLGELGDVGRLLGREDGGEEEGEEEAWWSGTRGRTEESPQ